MSFFLVEPLGPDRSWEPDWFDAAAALDRISKLDAASGEAYIQKGFWDQLYCEVIGPPDARLLIAYTRDTFNPPRFEYKGVVEEYELREGEASVEPAFVMFFPNSVAGMIRASSKAPGAASIANYVTILGKESCVFTAIPNASNAGRLQRPAEDILRVELRILKRNIGRVREARPDIADALQRAADSVHGTTEVGLVLGVDQRKERARWWPSAKAVIEDLSSTGALRDFEKANVQMTRDGIVNLLEAYITATAPIDLPPGRKKLRAEDAAYALTQAYAQHEGDILDAIAGR